MYFALGSMAKIGTIMSDIKYNHYYCERFRKNTFSYPYVTKPKISESPYCTYLNEGFCY